jgi:hypothetical protein
MTQALNLANFANKLNSSGQADTTSLQSGTYSISISGNAAGLSSTLSAGSGGTGLSSSGANGNVLVSNGTTWTSVSTLSATSGGTGLSSPGTSGNVLTSNGTAWVSSAPVAPTTFGAIGTYVMATYFPNPSSQTTYGPNITVAGSALMMQYLPSLNFFVPSNAAYNPSLTGTWRLMTTISTVPVPCGCGGATYWNSTLGLFVRIA